MEKKIVVRARAVIVDNNELLVVKHVHGEGFAALPGGHLEWGETVLECLEREIIEELGIKPTIGRLLYINNFVEEGTTQSIEFFFEIINSSEYRNFENFTRTHAHELTEICWVTPTDPLIVMPKSFGEDFKRGSALSDRVRYLNDQLNTTSI